MLSDQLTEKIIKAAFQVQEELGTGFSEKVYENALRIALEDMEMKCDQQYSLSVYFRGHLVGEFVADLIVQDTVVVELKTVKLLLPEHQAQVINYLSATKMKTGLLINFAKKGLELKRLYNARA